MDENENMADHLDQFFNTVDRLKEIDVKVSEGLLAILLLYSIPNNYENFRCAVEARDSLLARGASGIKLIEEFEARKCKYDCGENSQDAFFVKRKGKMQLSTERTVDSKNDNSPNVGSNSRRKTHKCNYCLHKGHKAADCWKVKVEVAEKKMESASLAEEVLFADAGDPLDCNQNLSKILDLERSKQSKHNDEESIVAVFKFCDLWPASKQKVHLATNKTAKI